MRELEPLLVEYGKAYKARILAQEAHSRSAADVEQAAYDLTDAELKMNKKIEELKAIQRLSAKGEM